MRLFRITRLVSAVFVLAGALLASGTPAWAGGPGHIYIPADYIGRPSWYCPHGSQMTERALNPGPGILVKNVQSEPQNAYHGPGFAADVINISHTESSWIEVTYTCAIPSLTVKTVIVPARTTSQLLDVWCSSGRPDGAEFVLLAGAFADPRDPDSRGVRYEETILADHAHYKFSNNNIIGTTFDLYLKCLELL